jgi:hypothetical protein
LTTTVAGDVTSSSSCLRCGLQTVGAGWFANDTLVLTIEVTVEREDRFQMDTGAPPPASACVSQACHAHVCVCVCVCHAAGGVPCDVTLKLPCGAEVHALKQSLQLASPFFRGALEDVLGGGLIPVSQYAYAWHCCVPLSLCDASHILSLR